MKRFIAIASASALLVVGSAFVVHAQTSQGTPACADIVTGDGVYTAPAKDALGIPTAAGKLTWEMTLGAPSCPDVQYSLSVYRDAVFGETDDAAKLVVSPTVLSTAAMSGDGVSQVLRFELEVNTNDNGAVCVVGSTIGGGCSPTTTKNGAAFDADGTGSGLLDRGPDGPVGGDVDADGGPFCIPVDKDGSGGRTFG